MNARPNIVLVHGAWADGSCWSGVIERLQGGGYHVTAPQFPRDLDWPMTSPGCVTCWSSRMAPTTVAGHSYGGQIMTALGTGAPNVAGLVYIAAFGIDEGESLGALLVPGTHAPGAGAI